MIAPTTTNDAKKKKEITDLSIQQNPYMNPQQKKEKLETCQKLIQYTRAGLIDGIIKSLQDGAAIDYKSSGMTALAYACFYGRSEIVKWLIQHAKPDIEIPCTATEITPLGIAIQSKSVPTVKVLLDNGAIATAKDNQGQTIFQYALLSQNLDIVKLIYETNSINLDERDESDGSTIIHHAAKSSPEIVDYLIKVGASLESITTNGRTILHKAVSFKNIELIKYLSKKPTLLNKQDKNDYSPLHLAVFLNFYEGIKILIENGAEKQLTDSTGKTPREMAQMRGLAHIVNFLGNSEIMIKAEKEKEIKKEEKIKKEIIKKEKKEMEKGNKEGGNNSSVIGNEEEEEEEEDDDDDSSDISSSSDETSSGSSSDDSDDYKINSTKSILDMIQKGKLTISRIKKPILNRVEKKEDVNNDEGQGIEGDTAEISKKPRGRKEKKLVPAKKTTSTPATRTTRKTIKEDANEADESDKEDTIPEKPRQRAVKRGATNKQLQQQQERNIVIEHGDEIEMEFTLSSSRRPRRSTSSLLTYSATENNNNNNKTSGKSRRKAGKTLDNGYDEDEEIDIEIIDDGNHQRKYDIEKRERKENRRKVREERRQRKERREEKRQKKRERRERKEKREQERSERKNGGRRYDYENDDDDDDDDDDNNNDDGDDYDQPRYRETRTRDRRRYVYYDVEEEEDYEEENNGGKSNSETKKRGRKPRKQSKEQDIYISDYERTDGIEEEEEEEEEENNSNNSNNTKKSKGRKPPTREEEEALNIFRISKPPTPSPAKAKGRPRKQTKTVSYQDEHENGSSNETSNKSTTTTTTTTTSTSGRIRRSVHQ